jgi:hypothetical protein
VSTWDSTKVRIQSGANSTAPGAVSYTLTTSILLNVENANDVSLKLSIADFVGLGRVGGLATSRDNTFVVMSAAVGDDTLGRDLVAVTDGKAQQAAAFYADVTKPLLSTFSFDAGAGVLTMVFDESLNASSVNVNGRLTVQSVANASASASAEYTLTNSTVSLNAD